MIPGVADRSIPQYGALHSAMWLWDLLFVVAAATTVALVVLDGAPVGRSVGAGVLVVACWAGWPLYARRIAMTGGPDSRPTAVYCVTLGLGLVVATALEPSANWAAFIVFSQFYWLLPLAAAIGSTLLLTVALPVLGGVVRGESIGGAFLPQSLFLALFGVLIGIYIHRVADESAERARLIADLQASQAEAADLSHRAGVATERERMAGEIHDTLAQGFTSIVTLLQAAQAELDTDDAAARRHVALAVAAAKENLQEARLLVAASGPGALAEHPLAEAIGRHVGRFAQETGADAAHGVSGTPRRLPAEREVVLLRAAQELLANVARHACAATVTVRLDYGPDVLPTAEGQKSAASVTLTVADDGAGFDPADVGPHSYGLAMMRARVERLGGRLDVDSAPGAGTTVTLELGE